MFQNTALYALLLVIRDKVSESADAGFSTGVSVVAVLILPGTPVVEAAAFHIQLPICLSN
jgi:hypothetical protein